mmetsp:Transcript_13071/g.16263  ORF Transcript_13071/g.16263 Transcript_13071/m.16263 type:complete len:253 (+) Transcript_13071:81-839(+)|eukprot:CAMPEP_0204882348 /NCGR_PEP_ID=MMETSP1349-20130617/3394_1 /ASSEMBLY_ACC=CAM_ASM_000710 /TAXON_ID=215587 /ORGANISM="Aplanochytrium stocchinoi, Strain GSBS06" /LENGTH=252 /DNA_ID=CAMNT_0052041643 /DNA_START=68 /DNA_END=826 /DNA_ORIENTATION=+
MDKFAKLAIWDKAMQTVVAEVDAQKEDSKKLKDQVVGQLFTLLQQLKRENSDTSDGGGSGNLGEAYVKLLQKCSNSLKEAQEYVQPFLEELTEPKGKYNEILSGAITNQCMEVDDVAENIWKRSCEQFTFYNPIANAKPQIITASEPKEVSPKPNNGFKNEMKKLKSDFNARIDTCNKTISNIITQLQECNDEQVLKALVESSAFISSAKRLRKNYCVDSMFEAIQRYISLSVFSIIFSIVQPQPVAVNIVQ